MAEFKSVYDLLAEIEPVYSVNDFNSVLTVNVAEMVSALELDGAMGYDRYGRLNVATNEQVSEVLDELAHYHLHKDLDQRSFQEWFSGWEYQLHHVGWLDSSIPNLKHKHQLWQESIGIHAEVGSEEFVRREPRRQSKFWMLSQAAIFLALKNAMNETQTLKVKGEIETIISDEGKSRYTIPLMRSLEGAGASMTETTFRANLREIFKTNTLDI